MKICITSQNDNLSAEVDPRFGRCNFFIIADSETGDFEAIPNPNRESMGGAGIQSAQLAIDKGAKAVLTGNVGPNAYRALKAADINVIIGVAGSVEEVIGNYRQGNFKETDGPSVDSKFGMR
ncbi:MAG: dinitrogenase iron-molybdenum cofactor biosynthesis protein [Candidatus Omnitrophica bacterium]|nr:dinitrogenase iron-molybdenum cofactor biosynthesis protein [Candidatus Omnitrophota bacterium]MBD3269756.1 dinitrogenase iron-molybdenum cofactor biosynthesis protein [Candidatus Omnitrophota bacterium]